MDKFNKKFKTRELKIIQIGNWIVSLRPQQVTLGSLVLSLDRKCPVLGELTEKEGTDLVMAFSEIENILKKAFNPQKINYLALMMIDEQVHFHIIPRYEDEVLWNGNRYEDKDWPKPLNMLNVLNFEEIEIERILSYLKSKV